MSRNRLRLVIAAAALIAALAPVLAGRNDRGLVGEAPQGDSPVVVAATGG